MLRVQPLVLSVSYLLALYGDEWLVRKMFLKCLLTIKKMLECFELCAVDASSFLSGDVSLFSNFFKPVEMFKFLLLPNNEMTLCQFWNCAKTIYLLMLLITSIWEDR